MKTKYLLGIAFLFILFSTNAQSVDQYKKAHVAVMAEIQDVKLKTFINDFSSALVNYDWKASRQFFDKDHYSRQMELYLNDDFMFGHLGKVGKRDTAFVHLFYIRETLGLSLDEQEKRITDPSIANLFELKNFSTIDQVYFIKKDFIQVESADFSYTDFTIVVITDKGKIYMGQCWIDSAKMKIFGAVG